MSTVNCLRNRYLRFLKPTSKGGHNKCDANDTLALKSHTHTHTNGQNTVGSPETLAPKSQYPKATRLPPFHMPMEIGNPYQKSKVKAEAKSK